MKLPRFSIFTLLGITAYVAVALIGLLEPRSLASLMILPLWVAALVRSFLALAPHTRPSPFAKGFAICFLALLVLQMFGHWSDRLLFLVDRMVKGDSDSMESGAYHLVYSYQALVFAHGSLWGGLLAGAAAAWHSSRPRALEPEETPPEYADAVEY